MTLEVGTTFYVDDRTGLWTYRQPSEGIWDEPDRRHYRPLVVIDPEDREQVERLAAAYHESDHIAPWPELHSVTRKAITDAIQGALRSLLAPPKPDEPTGLGAVIEADDGATWVRADLHTSNCWVRAGFGIRTSWPAVNAVRVLSEGVAA